MEKWALHWPSNQHLKVYKINHSGGQKFVWNGILLILEEHMLKNKFKEQFCQRCFSQRYNWVSKSDTGAKGPIHLGGSRGIHLLKTWSILSQRQTLSTSPTLSLSQLFSRVNSVDCRNFLLPELNSRTSPRLNFSTLPIDLPKDCL